MDLFTLLVDFAVVMLILIPSSIIHEVAHGYMAELLGDSTARYAGRLTLDPRSHVDIWGTLLMPLILYVMSGGSFMFAYAKPVPYNPYNLKNHRWGPALVGLAGPASNFLLALLVGLVIRFFVGLTPTGIILTKVVLLNLVLMVFNLVPIPPLDGSKILYALLPDSAVGIKNFLDRYGFIILIFFVFFLFQLISPIISLLFNIIIG